MNKHQQLMSSVLFAVSGGETGTPVNTNSDFKETMPASVTYTTDLQMAADSPLSETRIIISPNEVTNPDFGYYVCGFPSSVNPATVATHQRYFATGMGVSAAPNSLRLNPGRSTAGPFPINLPSNEYGVSQILADNFDRGHTTTSKLEVFPTLIQAGSNDLQGTVWGILANTVPPPSTLNRATLSSSVGKDRGEYVLDRVTEGVASVQLGDTALAYFSGQSVDPVAQTTRRRVNRLVPTNGSDTINPLCTYADLGLYYYTGNMDATLNVVFDWDTPAAPNPNTAVVLYADWAYLNELGQLCYASSEVAGAMATPDPGLELSLTRLSLSGAVVCPTLSRTGDTAPIPMFFVGLSARTYPFSSAGESAQVHFTLDLRIPEGSIGVRNYASYVFIEDYTGPLSITRKVHFGVIPTAANLPLLASSLQRPADSEFNSTLADINYQLTGHSYGYLGTRKGFGGMLARLMSPDAMWSKFATSKGLETNLDGDPQFSASGIHLSKALKSLRGGLKETASVVSDVASVAGPMAMMASAPSPFLSSRDGCGPTGRSMQASARPAYSASGRPMYEKSSGYKFYASAAGPVETATDLSVGGSAAMPGHPAASPAQPPQGDDPDWDELIRDLASEAQATLATPGHTGSPPRGVVPICVERQRSTGSAGSTLSGQTSIKDVPPDLLDDLDASLSWTRAVVTNLATPGVDGLDYEVLAAAHLSTADTHFVCSYLGASSPLLTVVYGLVAMADVMASRLSKKGVLVSRLIKALSSWTGGTIARISSAAYGALPDYPTSFEAIQAALTLPVANPLWHRFASLKKVLRFLAPTFACVPAPVVAAATAALDGRKRKITFYASEQDGDSAGARVLRTRLTPGAPVRGASRIKRALTSSGISEDQLDCLSRGDHSFLSGLTPNERESLLTILHRHGICLATRLNSSGKFANFGKAQIGGNPQPSGAKPSILDIDSDDEDDEVSIPMGSAESDLEDEEQPEDDPSDAEGPAYDVRSGYPLTVRDTPIVPSKDVPLFLEAADGYATAAADPNLSAGFAEDGFLLVSPSWAYPANPLVASAVARVTKAGRLKMTGKHGAGNFLLVDKTEVGEDPIVHVATIRVSVDPLDKAEYFPVKFSGSTITLHMSSKFSEVGLDRPGNHLHNVVLWMATTGLSNRDVFIDVDSESVLIPDGAIEGPSYTMALVYAALGLPVGPVLTGTLLADGRFGPVGDMQTKLDAMKRLADVFDQFIIPAFAPPTRHEEIRSVVVSAATALNTGEPFVLMIGDTPLQVSACASPFSLYSLMASGLVKVKAPNAIQRAVDSLDIALRYNAAKEAVKAMLTMRKDGAKVPTVVVPLVKAFKRYLDEPSAAHEAALTGALKDADGVAAATTDKVFGNPGGTAFLAALHKGLSIPDINPSGVKAKSSKSSKSNVGADQMALVKVYSDAVAERKAAKTAYDAGEKSFRTLDGKSLTKQMEAKWPKTEQYSSKDKMSMSGRVQGRVVKGVVVMDGGQGNPLLKPAEVFIPSLHPPVAAKTTQGRQKAKAVAWDDIM